MNTASINSKDRKAQTRASVAIYEQIREKILNKEIAPGEHLPSERALSEIFQRSRSTIREALRLLASEGYISTESGKRGSVVNKLTSDNVEKPLSDMLAVGKVSDEELVFFRFTNERQTIELAVERQTEQDILVLNSILEKQKNIDFSQAKEEIAKSVLKYDIEFHKALAKTSQNSVMYTLSKMMTNVYFQRLQNAVYDLTLEELRRFNEEICSDHAEMIDAFLARDIEKARSLIQRNETHFGKLIQ